MNLTKMENIAQIQLADFATVKGIDPRQVYFRQDVKVLLGISERTFWRMLKDGRLKFVRIKRSKKVEILGQWLLDAYENRIGKPLKKLDKICHRCYKLRY